MNPLRPLSGLFIMSVLPMLCCATGLGGQSNMRQIPLSEVKKHRSKNDTWLVLRGKVGFFASDHLQ